MMHPHERRCHSYLAALNRHDVAAALSHLSPAFRLRFPGDVSLGRAELPTVIGWDAGTHGRVDYDYLIVEDDHVSAVLSESNDFYTLLDLGEVSSHATFRFDADGLIVEQWYEPVSPRRTVPEALEAPLAWGRAHRPAEVDQLLPGGRMQYSEEMGRRWVAFLRAWRAGVAAGGAGLPG